MRSFHSILPAALLAVALSLGIAAPAAAIDGDGKFMMKGVGGKTCQELLRNDGVNYAMLDVFLDGFVSALNADRDDTYDIVPAAEWEKAMEWIVAYCGNNREHRLAIAAYRMIEHYHPRRVKKAPRS